MLYRDFLFRIVDLELVSARGDVQNLLVQFTALLAAFSLMVTVLYVPRYVYSTLAPAQLQIAAWGDEEFLIATALAVAGLFAILAWNTALPSRRDCFVLGVLPLRRRTLFGATVAALGTALAATVAAVNIFIGLCCPFLIAGPGAGLVGLARALGAYWITTGAAGLFICAAMLGVQSLAALLLSYRLFLRISGVLQCRPLV